MVVSSSMRAAIAATYGGDDPLANLRVEDVDQPQPAPGWVRVRVTTAALNRHDLWTLRGVSSRPLREPQILGCDGVGVVDAYAQGDEEARPIGVGGRVA